MEVIRTVRNLRAEMNVAPGRRATLLLKPHEGWGEGALCCGGLFPPLGLRQRRGNSRRRRAESGKVGQRRYRAPANCSCRWENWWMSKRRSPAWRKTGKMSKAKSLAHLGQAEQSRLCLQGACAPDRTGKGRKLETNKGAAGQDRGPHRRNAAIALKRAEIWRGGGRFAASAPFLFPVWKRLAPHRKPAIFIWRRGRSPNRRHALHPVRFQKDMRGTDFLQRSLAKTHRGAALTEAKPEQAEKMLEKGIVPGRPARGTCHDGQWRGEA